LTVISNVRYGFEVFKTFEPGVKLPFIVRGLGQLDAW